MFFEAQTWLEEFIAKEKEVNGIKDEPKDAEAQKAEGEEAQGALVNPTPAGGDEGGGPLIRLQPTRPLLTQEGRCGLQHDEILARNHSPCMTGTASFVPVHSRS